MARWHTCRASVPPVTAERSSRKLHRTAMISLLRTLQVLPTVEIQVPLANQCDSTQLPQG